MSALPEVAILVRTFEDAEYLDQALDSVDAQDYRGKIQLYVGYDSGSTDGTAQVIRRRFGWSTMGAGEWVHQPVGKEDRRSTHVFVHPHLTLAAATRYLLPKILDGGSVQRILLLDGDNLLDPDCVSRRVKFHAGPPPGLCGTPIRWGMNEGAPPFPLYPTGKVNLAPLRQGNFLDTLNPMWRADYLRDRILPLLETVPAGDLVDDYLMNLIAAMDGEADFHAVKPTASYRFRKGSLTERTDVMRRTLETQDAFSVIEGEAKVHPTPRTP